MRTLTSRTAAQVTPATSRFAWAGRAPLGALTIVGGPPGLGKTQLLVGMISRATRGKLDGDLAGKPCQALYVSAEDSLEHTLVPRLLAAGGVPDRVHFFEGMRMDNGQHAGLQVPRDIDVIDYWLGEHSDARIVVLDPIVAMIPATLNAHRDQHVRQALAPLATLVDKHQVACILVMHLNKNSEGDALNRLSGSIGFGGAARSVLLFASNPDDPRGEAGNQRVLAHVKCNVGPRQPSIGYRIEPRTIHTNETTIETSIAVRDADMAISATDLLVSPTSTGEATARGEAREFLLAELADGPVATNTLKQHAADAGIAWPTVERAKQQLGIHARRITSPTAHWVWPLPNTPPDVVDVVDGLRKEHHQGHQGQGDNKPTMALPHDWAQDRADAGIRLEDQ